MTPRRALYFVIAALVAGSFIVAASALLARWFYEASMRANAADPPASSIAMPLDAGGNGFQVVNNTRLVYRLSPYPPLAGQPHELNLIAIDVRTGVVRPVTPTLEIMREDPAGDAVVIDFPRNSSGGYTARGALFPRPGVWRMRVRASLFEEESYSTFMIVEAK